MLDFLVAHAAFLLIRHGIHVGKRAPESIIALDERHQGEYKGADGEMKDETCFVDVDTFGRTAETINQYMNKGRAILIEGRLRFRQWTTEDGQKRSKLSVVAENFQFVGGRGEGGGSPGRATAAAAPPADSGPGPDAPGPDDDIPF